MNRAERLAQEGEGRRGNLVGWALTILQRRLASSPHAIAESLRRRRERLEKRLREEQLLRRAAEATLDTTECRVMGDGHENMIFSLLTPSMCSRS